MKKLLVIFACILVYTACDDEPTSYLYVLKNNTSHKVSVQVYSAGFTEEQFSVAANSYYEKRLDWYNNFSLISTYADSVKINFDATKNLTFYRDSINQNHNIYEASSYSLVGDRERLKVYYYNLTEDDYNAAK